MRKKWNWKSTTLLRTTRELRWQGEPIPQTGGRGTRRTMAADGSASREPALAGTLNTTGAGRGWAEELARGPGLMGPPYFPSFTSRSLTRFPRWTLQWEWEGALHPQGNTLAEKINGWVESPLFFLLTEGREEKAKELSGKRHSPGTLVH